MTGFERVDEVLVGRLLLAHDPFRHLGLRRTGNWEGRQVRYLAEHNRPGRYHRARVGYFLDELACGHPLDPLVLDNEWPLLATEPAGLVLLDGNHRLCAAYLARRRWVAVSYSGEVQALRWLRGERRTPPSWLYGR